MFLEKILLLIFSVAGIWNAIVQYTIHRKVEYRWLISFYLIFTLISFLEVRVFFLNNSFEYQFIYSIVLFHIPLLSYLFFSKEILLSTNTENKNWLSFIYFKSCLILLSIPLLFIPNIFLRNILLSITISIELVFWIYISRKIIQINLIIGLHYLFSTVLFLIGTSLVLSAQKYVLIGEILWVTAWVINNLMLAHRSNSLMKLKNKRQEHVLERLYQKEKEQRQARKELEETVQNRTVEIQNQKEELEKQSGKLRAAYKKLKELDQYKEALTGMILHDLKNPLNVIIGLSDEKTAVHQSGKQMLNMVLNILDIQKFQETRIQVQLTNYSLKMVAERALAQVNFLAKDKNIEIKNEIPVKHWVEADEELVERIFINLLTNAIKYTSNNGTVTLKSAINEKQIHISVIDTGQGIPKKYLRKIFDKYGQVQARKSGIVRSTGLGLTFCKMVVEAHKGRIGVNSEVGKGSDFWFTLSLSEVTKGREDNFEPDSLNGNAVKVGKALNASLRNKNGLTIKDKEVLAPYIPKLKDLEVYDTSEIKALLDKIDIEKSNSLKDWKKEMENTIFVCNEARYIELLDI